MKLTLHLIENNRLIAISDETLSPLQANHIADVIHQWNSGEINEIIIPHEAEIIDMRTPQKEAIEAVVAEALNGVVRTAIRSQYDLGITSNKPLSEEEFRAKYGDEPLCKPSTRNW